MSTSPNWDMAAPRLQYIHAPTLSTKPGHRMMPGFANNSQILPYFWFCLKSARLTEASTLTMQLDANSFGSPVPPPPPPHHLHTRRPSRRNPLNLSWLARGTELRWITHPVPRLQKNNKNQININTHSVFTSLFKLPICCMTLTFSFSISQLSFSFPAFLELLQVGLHPQKRTSWNNWNDFYRPDVLAVTHWSVSE